ncbi:MAG: hypothetical protein A2Y33_01825 [Spirochaetes bacterium GWF1_51_8]|nr:MAG: hypothetical protein A2Y33_01825 [Spirochaetes bacterium GWF1_51_8]
MKSARLKPLYEFPLNIDYLSLRGGFLTENGKKAVLIFRRDNKTYYSINEEIFGGHDTIEYFNISPDGGKIWYVYREETTPDGSGGAVGGKWHIRIGEREFGPYDEIHQPDISPDLSRYCFVYRIEQDIPDEYHSYNDEGEELPPLSKWYVNIDGITSQAYDSVMNAEFDEKYEKPVIVYNIGGFPDESGSVRGGKWYLKQGNDTSTGFDYIHYFRMLQNGNVCLVYVNNPVFDEDAFELYVESGSWGMLLNGKQYGPFEKLHNPVIGPGENFGFAYKSGYKWRFTINDSQYGDYDDAGILVFSRDGSKFAYSYNIGFDEERGESGQWFIKVGETVLGGYDQIFDLVFSIDGTQYAYAYLKDGEWFFVFKGETYEAGEMMNHIEISPDGKGFAFSYVQSGFYYLNINGQVYGDYSFLHGLPVFYNDKQGFRFLFSYDRYYLCMNIDGREIIELRTIPSFYCTPDGEIQIVSHGDSAQTTLIMNFEEIGTFRSALILPGSNGNPLVLAVDDKRQVTVNEIELYEKPEESPEEE